MLATVLVFWLVSNTRESQFLVVFGHCCDGLVDRIDVEILDGVVTAGKAINAHIGSEYGLEVVLRGVSGFAISPMESARAVARDAASSALLIRVFSPIDLEKSTASPIARKMATVQNPKAMAKLHCFYPSGTSS